MDKNDSYEELQRIFKDLGITEKDLFGDKLNDLTKHLIKSASKEARKPDFGDGVEVSYGIDDPGPGVGYVKLSCEDVISISNTQAFASMCHVASAIEAYVQDGKIVIELTYSNAQLDN